jgi:hypothetical protein
MNPIFHVSRLSSGRMMIIMLLNDCHHELIGSGKNRGPRTSVTEQVSVQTQQYSRNILTYINHYFVWLRRVCVHLVNGIILLNFQEIQRGERQDSEINVSRIEKHLKREQ